MKYIKIFFASLLVLLLLGLAHSYWLFNTYAPKDDAVANDSLLAYYQDDYEAARQAFLIATHRLSSVHDGMSWQSIHVPSEVDTALYVDVCYIPPKGKTEKLVVFTSGVHGIEGHTGSAIQLLVLDKLMTQQGIDNVGFLFIHALNPYGFKYGRKATEINVDLNRNCVLKASEFETKNEGFGKMYAMLTPSGELDVNSLWNRSFHLIAIERIIKETMPVLRQAALQGQYDYPEGIYYGGDAYEPQIMGIQPLLKQYLSPYKQVLNVDLHTGYGQRGKMHLFIERPEDKNVEDAIASVFAGHAIDWSEGADFYTINGEYVGLVAQQNTAALVIPMLLEFGTMNSQETFGSLKSIHTMICENQGFNNGYVNAKSEQKAEADMWELYCPSSPAWRSKTLSDFNGIYDDMIRQFVLYENR